MAAFRRTSKGILACAAIAAVLSGCGPVYTASETYTLARDLETRPLDIEFNPWGMWLPFEIDGQLVEDPEAERIGKTWYPFARMRDPEDNYVRNMLTGVGVLSRFIDAENGELIDEFIDTNRVYRIRIGEQSYELSCILFLDSPRFDDPERCVDQRVRARTRNGRLCEGLIV